MTGPPPDTWAVDPAAAGARPVVDGMWRLRLPLPWTGIEHVNAYAVERDDGIMLVDCGSAGHPSHEEALDVALAAAGHRLADVRVLVATHAHSDHTGLAGHVRRVSGAELWMHPSAGHFYDVAREPDRFFRARGERALREGVPPDRLGPYADVREETDGADGPQREDRPLVDGVRLPSRLGDWEAIETPGHAPSHVCLLQRDHGLLIAGDLLCATFVPWFDYGFTPDPFAETLASLDRIEALAPVELTLPGHGRPLTDLAEVVEVQRAGFRDRMSALRSELQRGPATAYELTRRLFADETDLAEVTHFTEIVAYLRHLRLTGEVDRVQDGDGTYRHRIETGART